MADKPEMLPCPCCSSTRTDYHGDEHVEFDPMVTCLDCDVTAPTPEAWNNRTTPPKAEPTDGAPDLDIINKAYGWTLSTDGEVYGLVAGDHGYEGTGIFIPKEDLDAYFGTRKALSDARIAELEAALAEERAGFDLRWKADMRAIERWQDETGETLTWPDHADLCVWLMGELATARNEALEEAAMLVETRWAVNLGAVGHAIVDAKAIRALKSEGEG